MALQFRHATLGQRILFGAGKAAEHLASEIARLGAHRIMLIAAPAEQDLAVSITRDLQITLNHDDVAPHVPIDKAEGARRVAEENAIDLIITVGGGSTTGLAKAIAMDHPIPIVAVPTTYAGSEATNVWGLTKAGRKTTGIQDSVLPVSVIYDSHLTLSLPIDLTVASGLNAIAHCIDSMWAPRTNPINQALAAEGIRALATGLPGVIAEPGGIDGRDQCLYGAYLSAVAFASAGSGMHHKICHVLGGTYNLPHAQTHAAVLPRVLEYNAQKAPHASERIAAALDAEEPAAGLWDLYTRIDAPTALRDFGFQEDNIPEAASIALKSIPDSNPRPVDQESIEQLLHDAWSGTAPIEPGPSTLAGQLRQ